MAGLYIGSIQFWTDDLGVGRVVRKVCVHDLCINLNPSDIAKGV